MSTRRVEDLDESADHPRRGNLRAIAHDTAQAPYDEPILRQILETVERVAEAALRTTPTHDALLSAEDIAQDSVATLHQRGQPDATVNPTAWTIGIAKFKLKEATRRSRRQAPLVPLRDDTPVAPSSEEQVLGVMHYVWLLDHIEPMDRMIVEWRQAGFSSREVALELRRIGYPHMTANNVDQRFFRALKTLRTLLFAEDETTSRQGAGQGLPGKEPSS